MAEGTSARASSRRTTPQPAAPAARTTRTTRSQSRDVSDSEEARMSSKARRRGKQSYSEGADDRTGPSIPEGNRARAFNQPKPLQELSTVAEDPSISYPDLQVDGDDEEEGGQQPSEILTPNQQANIQSKSPGGVSAFSGTTARTSRSAQDFSELSTEAMLYALLDLVRASDNMLEFLIPSQVSEATVTALIAQLQIKHSPANKNLTRLATTLSVNRDMYGSESYIALQEVLECMVGSDHATTDKTGTWRPDALLQKANLAVLASKMFSQLRQVRDDQLVEELEQIFPLPFIEEFAASATPPLGSSELANETFQLALDIRTQCAIMMLARHASDADFDPNSTLLKVFCKTAKTLRGWGIRGLRAEELTREAEKAILARLERLEKAFALSEDEFTTGIELLQLSFPWTALVTQTLTWINLRLKELNRQISVLHGADRIFEALQEKVQRVRLGKSSRRDDGQNDDGSPQIVLEYEPPSEIAEPATEPQELPKESTILKTLKLPQFNANSPKARSAVSTLKRLEATHKAGSVLRASSPEQNPVSESDVQVMATAESSTRVLEPQSSGDESVIPSTASANVPSHREPQPQQDDDWRAQDQDDAPLLAESDAEREKVEKLRRAASEFHAMYVLQQIDSNKENIVIPMSQPEAQTASSRKRRLIDPQPNAQRLGFDDLEELDRNNGPSQMEDPSQDEGFQTQNISAGTAQRRSLKPAFRHPASLPARPHRPSPKRPRNQEAGRPSRVETVQEGMDDEPSPSPFLAEYRAANTAAKELKAFKPKPPQTRNPWSEEETEKLLTLIEKYGTKWSQMLKDDKIHGDVLKSRDQVALKDKARNIKMDYLKAGRMLPRNFECIPISKIQRDVLAALNIEYDIETGQRVDAIANSDSE